MVVSFTTISTKMEASLESTENSASRVVEEPPAHLGGDWMCFRKILADPEFEIKSYYDRRKWTVGDTFQLRVSNVYDPSHFWIVTKFKELEVLQKYLNHFYTRHKEHYKIECKLFKLNMYCICYADGSFFRGILNGIELQYSMTNLAFVFLIDFGYTAKVPITELYFMTRHMYDIPKFAVRAALSEVCSTDLKSWSTQAVNEFNSEVINIILTGMVTHVVPSCKLLFLRLCKVDDETGQNRLVGEGLIQNGVASQFVKENTRKKQNKLLFLEPLFKKLEEGLVPDMHIVAKSLAQGSHENMF